jgi:hypothetical protein
MRRSSSNASLCFLRPGPEPNTDGLALAGPGGSHVQGAVRLVRCCHVGSRLPMRTAVGSLLPGRKDSMSHQATRGLSDADRSSQSGPCVICPRRLAAGPKVQRAIGAAHCAYLHHVLLLINGELIDGNHKGCASIKIAADPPIRFE